MELVQAGEVSQDLFWCHSLALGALSQGNLCLVISDLWSGSSEEGEDEVAAAAGRK